MKKQQAQSKNMNRDVTNFKLFCQYLQSWTFLSKVVRVKTHLYTTMYDISP